ncbi:MAG: Major facilitator superfamily transporter [Candidatus Roizmanbacteria bacterium GW2011_GWC2_37_13]|uniref:Major facilitator superfamily transporter n=1 Tax=Candidatus Roizmanbacteria bacterium GW2011_GWC2_37_13 TaxID=1618486 RepID=A0A0G0GHG9_9BACT|nr:MAG: Major facilitator superfamily transporter [Candidatus Roizmanbacteria bacterium GW2011_GWC1_37_12]KKQ25535.1 MAG: Major facilitator superfamily transporter [Candidatus Roizmanbacteria bacterium GW2011_GWC2_37_13]
MRNNKSLMTIFLIVFIDLLGFGIILPLLPYIAEKYQATPAQIGILTATYSFFQLIASPIFGRLSDRYGRKKLLIISQLGSAVGYLILGLAGNLPLLFLSRIIDGITGGNISIAQAYIADVTTKENRARGMGLIGAAFGLGFIFGPAIGGALSKISYSTPAYFATAVSLITVLTTIFFLKETVNEDKASHSPRTKFSLTEFKRVLSLYPIGLLISVFFLLNTAFSIMQGNFALWTQKTFNFEPSQNGWLFTYVGILAVLIQMQVLPRVIKKFHENNILLISLLSMFIGLTLIPLSKHPNFLYVALFFIPLGNGLANPTIQALASENVPKEEYGETLGIMQSAGSMGRILGPIIGGEIFQALGKDIAFYFAGLIIFFTFVYLKLKLK